MTSPVESNVKSGGTHAARWWAGGLILLGILLAVGKWEALPTSGFLADFCSLRDLPPETSEQVGDLLLVPMAAIVVVFVRLTLGLRMLGPFRPILIAVGLKGTGVLLGLGVLLVVAVVILFLRPRLKAGRWLPYFGRLTVLLSTVVLVQILTLLLSRELEIETLGRTVYFPIIVLTLAADGFARALAEQGSPVALFRGTVTVLVALPIVLLDQIPGVHHFLLGFPELILTEIGLVFFISHELNFRCLQKLNPDPRSEAASPS